LGTKKKISKWWAALAKQSGVKEEVFTPITPREQEYYIDTVLKNFDAAVELEPRAKSFLAKAFAEDTGRLTQELKRLALTVTNHRITLAQVEASVAPTREAVTFQALDSLVQGNKARAIALFRQEETEPDAPFALLGLCAWQVRRLIAIKELAETGKDIGSIARELKTLHTQSKKPYRFFLVFLFHDCAKRLLFLLILIMTSKPGASSPVSPSISLCGNSKTNTPQKRGVFFMESNLFLSQFLDTSVQARLLPSSGVFLDDILLCCLIDGLLSLLIPFLSDGKVSLLDGFQGLLGSALDHSFDRAVAGRILSGHAHVLLS
jgi:hypothetical protein